jgi:hypothetical protein
VNAIAKYPNRRVRIILGRKLSGVWIKKYNNNAQEANAIRRLYFLFILIIAY